MSDKSAREVLELLRCNCIESVEDGRIDLSEEMRRQREFITETLTALRTIIEAKKKEPTTETTASQPQCQIIIGNILLIGNERDRMIYNTAIDDILELFK